MTTRFTGMLLAATAAAALATPAFAQAPAAPERRAVKSIMKTLKGR